MKRNRSALPALVLAASLGVGCTVTHAHPVGLVSVRNESRQSVRVEIDRPSDWPWSFFGPQRMVSWVPPWEEGWCPAATLGLTDQGTADTLPESRVVVSGSSLPQPAEFPGIATRAETGGLALTIDASGTLRVERSQPELLPGCVNYPLQNAP